MANPTPPVFTNDRTMLLAEPSYEPPSSEEKLLNYFDLGVDPIFPASMSDAGDIQLPVRIVELVCQTDPHSGQPTPYSALDGADKSLPGVQTLLSMELLEAEPALPLINEKMQDQFDPTFHERGLFLSDAGNTEFLPGLVESAGNAAPDTSHLVNKIPGNHVGTPLTSPPPSEEALRDFEMAVQTLHAPIPLYALDIDEPESDAELYSTMSDEELDAEFERAFQTRMSNEEFRHECQWVVSNDALWEAHTADRQGAVFIDGGQQEPTVSDACIETDDTLLPPARSPPILDHSRVDPMSAAARPVPYSLAQTPERTLFALHIPHTPTLASDIYRLTASDILAPSMIQARMDHEILPSLKRRREGESETALVRKRGRTSRRAPVAVESAD
ncbi:hypothetical protein DFH09DRAFT_1365707 [Mycena vulgaris]|nr:hypothetical protein DFH09DRAFT_1365707 [Mycena vulgaris]